MISGITIQWRGETWGLSRREVNVARRLAHEDALFHWHAKFKPRHFETSAYSRYHYQRRSRKYEEQKRRRHGHNRPLVFSGESMTRSLAVFRASVTAFRAELREVVKTWNFKAKPHAPNMFEELRRKTHEEVREIVNVFAERMRHHLAVSSGGMDMAMRTIQI